MGSRIRLDPSSRLPLPGSILPSLAPPRVHARAPYVELCARSNFSFLQGASSPEALVRRAVELGYDALGITDRDGLYGIVRAHEAAHEAGLRLVVGCELTIDGSGSPWTLLVHVENHVGYTHLCRVLTESHHRHPKGKRTKGRGDEELPANLHAGVPVEVLAAHAEGLFCTVLPRPRPQAAFDLAALAVLHQAFGERLSIGVHRHLDGEDGRVLRAAKLASAKLGVPCVLHNGVRLATAEDKPVLDVLHCIREGVMLDEAGRSLLPNAEARLKSEAEMRALFPEHPEWEARARSIAEACRFSMQELRYKFPNDGDYPGETPDEALRRLSYEGAARRYAEGIPDKVRAQVEKELGLIAQLEVATYFLCVRSIVEIARSKDILCQGRGSAANSAVCFCIGITAVDPARSSLLFERFLSPERREPPDIDVDFEHDRREEVIQAIYERYGRDRAAMVSEVICYRGKSALREVGKVFGFSLEQVERLSSLVTWWDTIKEVSPLRLREAGFEGDDARVRMCLAMSQAIQGFPRHLSVHVGGFVLSATPLEEIAPVEPATMPDRTVVPWDKDDIDALGFFKMDVLGLGILTAIRKAMVLAQRHEQAFAGRATVLDMLAAIPAEDPAVYESLCQADTVGVFQIESRAQMAMLPRLKPRSFYDLVIEVAIVRPGPIQGGMVHPYLRRRNGEEKIDVPHACLLPILERTLGVPLFQEQVMEIAIKGAGYSGGEADQLRRDMAAWKKNGKLSRHKERLERGFRERGISQEFSDRLYAQIQGFGEYGFPESHAASFALLVYASAWLKVHHPAAFAAALVNSQPMGFYSPNTLLKDAQRHGVPLAPIDVTKSDWDCTLERHQEKLAIRVGLRLVKGLGEEVGRRIEEARKAKPFAGIEDLRARAGLAQRDLDGLAEAGALRTFERERRAAMWKVRAPKPEALFEREVLPEEPPSLPPLERAAQLLLDFERTGLSVRDHPMRVLRDKLPKDILDSRQLGSLPHGARVRSAGLVICRQRPGTASGVVFLTLEDEHGFVNLVLWARVFEKLRHVATTSAMLVVTGKLEASKNVVYIIAEELEKLTLRGVRVPAMSRDFH